MAPEVSISELLADIRRRIKEPYRWPQVRALLPLFYLRLTLAAIYVLSVLSLLPAGLYTPLEWLLNLGVTVCLFCLVSAHGRYQPGAVLMTLSLGIGFVSPLVGSPPLLMTMSALCALFSGIFEYSGHAKIAARQDKTLAKRWNTLFFWSMGAMLAGAGAFFFLLILSYVFEPSELVSYIVTITITYVPDFVVDILYLVYLGRTIRLVKHTPDPTVPTK